MKQFSPVPLASGKIDRQAQFSEGTTKGLKKPGESINISYTHEADVK
ncbi:MAG: hypothetical protein GY703_09045 [Gammaproteobacteria bacterium]|nr:hypothetical protein [Gammaproteobacteria bacterium]